MSRNLDPWGKVRIELDNLLFFFEKQLFISEEHRYIAIGQMSSVKVANLTEVVEVIKEILKPIADAYRSQGKMAEYNGIVKKFETEADLRGRIIKPPPASPTPLELLNRDLRSQIPKLAEVAQQSYDSFACIYPIPIYQKETRGNFVDPDVNSSLLTTLKVSYTQCFNLG